MGSLAGAAHPLKDNANVLRYTQWGQKPHVEHKGKGMLDASCPVNSCNWKQWPNDPLEIGPETGKLEL